MKLTNRTIVYSINVNDLQNVAEETLGRTLSDKEAESVGDCIGDYIDWVQAIENAISKVVIDTDSPYRGV